MFDYGICEHLVRVAIIEEISLPGKYFISLKKKIKKKNLKYEFVRIAGTEKIDN